MTIRYSEHHLWALPSGDGTFFVGISDYAQNMLGDIVFVQAPPIGTKLQPGQVCGFVESVKTASDLHSPLSGEVIALNDSIKVSPEQLNETPEESWIFRIRANHPDEFLELMDVENYQNIL